MKQGTVPANILTLLSVMAIALFAHTGQGYATTSVPFTTPLTLGDTHAEVISLQTFLNTHGFVVASQGPGSPGSETDYFGAMTKDAVVRFQTAHAATILTPAGLTQATGYFGPSSIRTANMLLVSGDGPAPTDPMPQVRASAEPTITLTQYQDILKRIEQNRRNTENVVDKYVTDDPITSLSGVTLTNSTFTDTDASFDTLTVAGVGTLAGLTVTATTTLDGLVVLSPTSVPSETTNTLYNVSGDLYWNGTSLTSATSGAWSVSGSNVYRTSGSLGIGTSNPSYTLHVLGTIGAYRGIFSNATTEADATTIGGSGEAIKLWANSGGAELKTASSTRLRINNQVRFDGDNFSINTPALVLRTTDDTDSDTSKGAMIEYQQTFTNIPHAWGLSTEKYKDGAALFTPTAGAKRVSWLSTHYDSPASTGEGVHQHFNIETAKEDLATIITRFQISYGEDVALVGFPNSNVQFFDNKNVYFGSDRDVTMKYDTTSGTLKILGQTTDSTVETTNAAALALEGTLTTTGSVGIGTTSPTRLLHVSGASSAAARVTDTTNNVTGEIRADDFQVFMGSISNSDVRLMTNGSSRLSVTSAGFVGIGTTSPSYQLHVARSTDGDVAAFSDTNGTCTINPTNTALVCSSDANLKKDIVTIPNALERLTTLRGVNFLWKKEDEDALIHFGFIAQEVEKTFPEFVMQDTRGYKMVNTSAFTPVIVESIKALNLKVDDLAAQYQGTHLPESTTIFSDTYTYLLDQARSFGVTLQQGVVHIRRLIVDDELCIGDTCLTEAELAALKATLVAHPPAQASIAQPVLNTSTTIEVAEQTDATSTTTSVEQDTSDSAGTPDADPALR